MKRSSKNIQTVLDILQDGVNGYAVSTLKKMTPDYTMTWVEVGKNGKDFPTTTNNLRSELKEVYQIKGREYDIRNIAEGDDVVFAELIESYPDPKTKKVYRPPLVLVLEMKNRKVRTGRHYLDPRLSRKFLTKAEVEKAYKNNRGSLMLIH